MVGISYDEVVGQLEIEGVQKFEEAWAKLGERMKEQLQTKGTSA